MRTADIRVSEIYRVFGCWKDNGLARVLEKGLRTEWHRHKPRTSVLIEWIDTGLRTTVEARHLSPARSPR